MSNELKGIGGWLLFFVIVLILITPIASFADIFLNPSFYFYESGAFDYFSLIFITAFSAWSIFVGLSIYLKNRRAIVWAKEFLIATTIISIIFTIYTFELFTIEQQSTLVTDIFRQIVFFTIWFWYLSVSKRVKNTFKDRKLNFVRVAGITGIAFLIFFVLGLIYFLVPASVESASETITAESPEISDSLKGGFGLFYEFSDQDTISDVYLSFKSTNGVADVYFVRSESEFDKFLNNEDFDIYGKCSSTNTYFADIKCTVSSGGFFVYNPNDFEITYTFELR